MSPATAVLQRQDFRTSRSLEYLSEKELILQTGHQPERWAEVVFKELSDNSLDACESHEILPEIAITIGDGRVRVEDNGPGLPRETIQGVLDFSIRVSSKDAYISPTRGAQGNALKTIATIPYVSGLSDPVTIRSRGWQHTIRIALDRIAQEPRADLATEPATVRTGTVVEVPLSMPNTAGEPDPFTALVEGYSLFNPHATISFTHGDTIRHFTRTTETWSKWRPTDPTSPHWYTPEQLRTLIARYIHAERQGGRALFVRDFLAEFKGLSSTVKRKAVLDGLPLAGMALRDLVTDGDLDDGLISKLLTRMQAASTPVKPQALGVLGEPHLRAWLEQYGGARQTVRYKRVADVDEATGLPFVAEIAFAGREDQDSSGRRLVTGINFAPTLVNPFREFAAYGMGLDGLLSSLHVSVGDPVTIVVHLTSPHLNFTDRGKSSLETL